MPRERIIPRAEWMHFLNGFSREHDAWIASVEVRDPAVGTSRQSEELALGRIAFDTQNREIVLQVGSPQDRHLTHVVREPKRLWLWHQPEAGAETLEILADGKATLLRVRPPVEEMVDALSSC
jgi:hypothetical protein